MANVLLKWDALPTDTADVNGIRVFRTPDAGTAATSDAFVTANAAPGDVIPSTSTQLVDISGITGVQHIDKGVTAGDSYYAVYSYNDAGYSTASITSLVQVS